MITRATILGDGEFEAAGSLAHPPEEVIIKPRPGWVSIDWRELYKHRELLFFLILRDVKVRYKQTVLGVGWAVLQPVFMMLIFTIFFGQLADVPSQGYPYPVFVYSGLLAWVFFSNAVTLSGLSLVNHQALLTKVYLPRIFVPAAHVGGALIDLGISLVVFMILMAAYGFVPGPEVVMVPLLIVLTVAAALGAGLTLAALTVTYRDFRYLQQFLLQIWMFLSFVIYPVSELSARAQLVASLNPLVGIVQGFRSAFLGVEWNWPALGISTVVTVLMLLFGLFYFRKTERRFADIA